MPPRREREFRGRYRMVRYRESAGKTARLVRAFGAHADERRTRKVLPLPGAFRAAYREECRRRSSMNPEFIPPPPSTSSYAFRLSCAYLAPLWSRLAAALRCAPAVEPLCFCRAAFSFCAYRSFLSRQLASYGNREMLRHQSPRGTIYRSFMMAM
jgi:hypothetical protein